jgi:hypothetical protein
MRVGGSSIVNIIEQETGVGQQVCVYTKQFACLPEALPPTMQKRTDLAVKSKHVRKDASRRQLRVCLG